MVDNELLLAILGLLDEKLDEKLVPIKNDIQSIKLNMENDIKPQLRLLTESYVSAAKRHESEAAKISALEADVEIMKRVIAKHSEKLQQLA